MAGSALVSVSGKELQLSHLDKIYYPEDGITKAELMTYYTMVAPYILPHLKDRPLSLRRYPEGIHGESFFQKQAPEHAPAWVRRVPIRTENRVIDFVLAEDLATLVWLVNLGCIDQNPWHSRVPDYRSPDYVIFDLDPFEPAGLSEAIEVGLLLRQVLTALKLESYPKLSGATGFHVYVPVRSGYTYRQVREFAGWVGRLLMSQHPELITMEWSLARRTGKVFFDHNMNSQGKTVASVYSPRPFAGGTVSTPLRWSEVHPRLDPRDFTIRTLQRRQEKVGDLFAPVLGGNQSLHSVLSRILAPE